MSENRAQKADSRSCESCAHGLRPGEKASNGDGPFGVTVCTHERIAGARRHWGYVAASSARAWDGACGPEGAAWNRRQ